MIKKIGIFVCLWVVSFSGNAQAGKLINEHLPKWANVDVEFRHRFEYQDDLDFNGSVDDTTGFNLYRTRLNIAFLPVENFKLFSQFQDARIANSDFENKTTYENYMDVRQLYLEASNLFSLDEVNLSKFGIRGGRQELSYGTQRLLGGFNWSNIAQTFDAGKIMLTFEDYKLNADIFGGTKTQTKSPEEADDLYDGTSKDIIGGYYAAYKGIENMTVENYLIRRKTNKNISFGPSGSRELDEYTFGGRIVGKVPDHRLDYEVEVAKQWGDFDYFDIDAMMTVVIVGYTLDHAWNPRLAFEFDYGSGDNDTSDETRRTFDNLFPTNHLFYGYMDRVSLQNLNDYSFQLSVSPTKKLKLETSLHLIYLDTAKDSLYNAARGVTRTATGAGIDTHVGNELDFLAKYKACDYADILAGYSHFFAGDYLKDSGANDDGDFAYIQTTFSY